MQEVIMQKRKEEITDSLIPGLLGTVGTLVGTYYGGPAGGAAGGAAGEAVGQGITKTPGNDIESVSNPRDRAASQIQNDPTFKLQQGKAALSGMDEQDKVMLEPVLDEALKKAWEKKRTQNQTINDNTEIA